VTLTWTFEVDWDADGVFERDEAPNLFSFHFTRGKQEVIGQDGRFGRYQVGRGTALLRNLDGTYDPWNTTSPIYPHFMAGKRFRMQVSDGTTAWPVVTGRIQRINYASERAVRLDLEDDWAVLQEEVHIPVQRNVYAGSAMNMVLDHVGWPGGRDISAGVDVKKVWWCAGKAGIALQELAEAEFGVVSVRADGTFWFRSRHDSYPTAANVTTADIQHGFRLPLPWETIRTVVRVRAYQPEDVSGMIYEHASAFQVQGNSTESVWITPQDVYMETITGVDVTANEKEDGSGTDMSAYVSAVATLIGAQRVKIDVTNTASGPVWVTSLRLNGSGVKMGAYVEREAVNNTGLGLYGERVLLVDNFWLQDALVAKDFADHFAFWYGEPTQERAFLRVRLKANPALQFGVDIGDVVDIDMGDFGGRYRVMWIAHRWTDRAGQVVETEWLLDPRFDFSDEYWFFPTKIGVSSRFGF